MSPELSRVERLETRIAPATLTGKALTWTDTDGDSVSLTLKTKADVAETAFTFNNAFDTTGAQILKAIALNDQAFAGASLMVKVTQAGGGDGSVDIGTITAAVDLKAVSSPGDIAGIIAGTDGGSKVALASLSVGSLGVHGDVTAGTSATINSMFFGNVGKVTVTGDIGKASIVLAGSADGIKSLSIGGAMQGELNAAKIGKLSIAGALDGSGDGRGVIFVGAVGTASIGSIVGGDIASGGLNATKAGKVTIKGDISATSPGTGFLRLGTAKALRIEGSVTSSAFKGAEINIQEKVGSIFISGDLKGGSIIAGSAKSLEILGEIDGTAGEGGSGVFIQESLGTLKVGGALRGGEVSGSGSIQVSGSLGASRVGSLLGGLGERSGSILVSGNIGIVEIAEDFISGAAFSAGAIISTNGKIGQVRVGGMIDGSASGDEPVIEADGGVAGLNVAGDVIQADIHAGDTLGAVKIGGKVVGTAADGVLFTANNRIGSVSITGSARFLLIDAGSAFSDSGNPDAQIGAVKIVGAATGLKIFAGIGPGQDGIFATSDDTLIDPSGGGKAKARLAGVTLGSVTATEDTADAFAIVAEEIGKIVVGGSGVALKKGAGNDAFSVAVAGDLIAFEVAPQ